MIMDQVNPQKIKPQLDSALRCHSQGLFDFVCLFVCFLAKGELPFGVNEYCCIVTVSGYSVMPLVNV